MSRSAVPRPRDRAATEQRIVDAAIGILSDDGFVALGINPLADRAGVDKQLIYRYFGGLDGVVAALGARLDLWLGDIASERAPPAASYAELIARLADAYIVSLRRSRLLQRLLAWELVQPTPTLAALDNARSAAVTAWLGQAKGELAPPAGVDAPAINALLLAGIHHLVLREASVGRFAGLDLAGDAGWCRIRAAARQLVQLAYAAPAPVRAGCNPPARRTSPASSRKSS